MAGSCPGGISFMPQTINMGSQVGSPAETIYIINSIWDRSASGTPIGGGNWGLDPPCRYYAASQGGGDSFPPLQGGCLGYWWFGAWVPSQPNAWNVFGGAWPWHGNIANVGFADGHAKGMVMSQTTAGCDVRDYWGGYIFDKAKYMWDLY
jgi:prepilin-type processing-associated H-X9-DG protein